MKHAGDGRVGDDGSEQEKQRQDDMRPPLHPLHLDTENEVQVEEPNNHADEPECEAHGSLQPESPEDAKGPEGVPGPPEVVVDDHSGQDPYQPSDRAENRQVHGFRLDGPVIPVHHNDDVAYDEGNARRGDQAPDNEVQRPPRRREAAVAAAVHSGRVPAAAAL